MPAQIRYLPDFLKRLRTEKGTPFTWLIGAGVSVTSGIPLAEEISRRIILFEYLVEKEIRLGESSHGEPLTYEFNELDTFFNEYEKAKESGVDFQRLSEDSIRWLRTKPGFTNITPDQPECYQLLFRYFFQDPTIHHVFLTSLVRRAKVVNLAHLGLAGLLRDHLSSWGHTVFTTNFDDLLLKALLILNHTARVFGDLESTDVPSLTPSYPQIVHLHGRHTGYRLRNTHEQTTLIDPIMRDSFANHIAHSHLVVLGYSGWDDLVMKVLEQWPQKESLLRGNLYWIPFQHEGTIPNKVRAFLDACPLHRVHIIVSEKQNLNADSFILALCDALNRSNGGFQQYRGGILNHAENQHRFTLSQLKEHPEFDPDRALILARQAKGNIRLGQRDAAQTQIDLAYQLVQAEDISDLLRGQVYLEIGICKLLLSRYAESERHLLKALPLWDKVKPEYDFADLHKAHTLRALGELYVRRGEVENGKERLKIAKDLYVGLKADSGTGHTMRLLAEIAAREGKGVGTSSRAWTYMQNAFAAFQTSFDAFGQATCQRGFGDLCRLAGQRNEAIKHYEAARELFQEIGDELGVANTLKGLADLHIQAGDEATAIGYLDTARAIYRRLDFLLGLANVESAVGDISVMRDDYEDAIGHYEQALEHFRALSAHHGRSNALADLMSCYAALSRSSMLATLSEELKPLTLETGNGYAWNVMIRNRLVDPVADGKLPH